PPFVELCFSNTSGGCAVAHVVVSIAISNAQIRTIEFSLFELARESGGTARSDAARYFKALGIRSAGLSGGGPVRPFRPGGRKRMRGCGLVLRHSVAEPILRLVEAYDDERGAT